MNKVSYNYNSYQSNGFYFHKGTFAENDCYVINLAGMSACFRVDEIAIQTKDNEIVLQFINSNRHASMVSVEPNKSVVHLFLGSESTNWVNNLVQSKKILYKEIYPEIDMLCYRNNGRLEFDFILSPRANWNDICISVNNADLISVDSEGHLSLDGITIRKPFSYQEINGEKIEVNSRYVLNQQQIQFEIDDFDGDYPLIIDPIVEYSTYIGGDEALYNEGSYALTSDDSGNLYIVGHTSAPDFPTKNALQDSLKGNCNAFLSKFNRAGELVFSTYLGGNGDDEASAIALDNDGYIYLTGSTSSTDFPTVNAYQSQLKGGVNTFLTKLNPDGTEIVFSTYLGGSKEDYGTGIAVDNSHCVYVGGYTNSQDYILERAYQENLKGETNAFVTKLSEDGASVIFSTYIGGIGNDIANALDIDRFNNIYLAGNTNSQDFPVFNPILESLAGKTDCFITELSADGQNLVFSTFYGGNLDDYANDMVVGEDGSIFVVGSTESDNFPVRNAIQDRLTGQSNAFVVKILAGEIVFATYLGGSNFDYANCVDIDQLSQIYLTGGTASPDFPTVNAIQQQNQGNTDGFVTKISASGDRILYSTFLGGTQLDIGTCISCITETLVGVTGITSSEDFPVEQPSQAQLAGFIDGFVTTISETSNLTFRKIAVQSSVYVGETAEFILSVKNVGNGLACDVTVTDYLPLESELVRIVPSKGVVNLLGYTLTWSFDNIPPLQEETLSIVVKTKVCGTLENRAYMRCDDAPEQYQSATVRVLSKLSTGPLCKSSCNTMYNNCYQVFDVATVLFQNISSTEAEVELSLYDLTTCNSRPSFIKTITIYPNCTTEEIMRELPDRYCFTYDHVPEGVLISTYLKQECCYSCCNQYGMNSYQYDLNQTKFLSHSELISITNC